MRKNSEKKRLATFMVSGEQKYCIGWFKFLFEGGNDEGSDHDIYILYLLCILLLNLQTKIGYYECITCATLSNCITPTVQVTSYHY